MNIEALRTFVTLANCGSFTRTAQDLSVVQSTVSSRIKELENELGQELFTRGKNSAALTKAGLILLSYARSIIDLETAAISDFNKMDRFEGVLSIAAAHTLYDSYLFKQINQFLTGHPTISIRATIAHTHEIIASLGGGSFDIAYTYSFFSHPKFTCIPYRVDPVVLVTASSNTTYLEGITSKELSNITYVYSDFEWAGYDWVLPKSRGYPLEVNIMSRIISYLEVNNWYCFLPLVLVEKEIKNGSLIEIKVLDMKIPDMRSYLIYKNQRNQFIDDWLETELSSGNRAPASLIHTPASAPEGNE